MFTFYEGADIPDYLLIQKTINESVANDPFLLKFFSIKV